MRINDTMQKVLKKKIVLKLNLSFDFGLKYDPDTQYAKC